jgi:hypothetical protein
MFVQLTFLISHPKTRPREHEFMHAKSSESELTTRLRSILPDIIFVSMILISVVGLFFAQK